MKTPMEQDKQTEEEESLVYNPNGLGRAIGVSRSVAYQLTKRPDFPAFRIGHRIIIPKASLNRWLAEQAERTSTW